MGWEARRNLPVQFNIPTNWLTSGFMAVIYSNDGKQKLDLLTSSFMLSSYF